MEIEDEGTPVERYHVCNRCAHYWLTEEADRCENCGSVDLVTFFEENAAEEWSQDVVEQKSAR